MKILTITLALLATACIHGQSNSIQLCDQQATRHCITIKAPATLPANVTCTTGTTTLGTCAGDVSQGYIVTGKSAVAGGSPPDTTTASLQAWYDTSTNSSYLYSMSTASSFNPMTIAAKSVVIQGQINTGGGTISAIAVDSAGSGKITLSGDTVRFIGQTAVYPQFSGTSLGKSGGEWSDIFVSGAINAAGSGGALNVLGSTSGNGNIVLLPGNVAGNASVVINSARVDQPGLYIKNTAGTTVAPIFAIRDNSSVSKFYIMGSTDASCANCLYTTGNLMSVNNTTDVGSIINYWQHGFFGGTVEATKLRVINGNPGSVSDYFDWYMGANGLIDLRDSSNNLVWRYTASGTKFSAAGHLWPLTTSNIYDLGDTSLYWRNLYLGTSLKMGGTTVIDSSRNVTVNDLTIGGTCTGCGSSSFLPLAGGTMTGSIIGSTTQDIGSGAGYFHDGYFGGIVESSKSRVILGTPASVTSFFDWTVDSTNLLRLKDSSSTTILQVDNTGSPVAFIFSGDVLPSSGSGHLGNTSLAWASVYTAGLTGPSITNGNIVLQPGNISGNASTVAKQTRTDQPALYVAGVAGTTTAPLFTLRDSANVARLYVMGHGDSSCPDCMFLTSSLRPVANNTGSIGDSAVRWAKYWGVDGDYSGILSMPTGGQLNITARAVFNQDTGTTGAQALQIGDGTTNSSLAIAGNSYITLASGASALFASGSALTVLSGGSSAYNSGSTMGMNGTLTLNSGGQLIASSGSTTGFNSGATLAFNNSVNVGSTGSLNFAGSSAASFASGATATFASGSNLAIQAGSVVSLHPVVQNGVAPIVDYQTATGQNGTAGTITDHQLHENGGSLPAGLYRVTVSGVCSTTAGTGAVTLAIIATNNSSAQAPSSTSPLLNCAGTSQASFSVAVYTDGTTVGGLSGLTLRTTVGTGFSGATYAYYASVERITI